MRRIKSKGVSKFIYLIFVTIAITIGASLFFSSRLSGEAVIADIAGLNYKIMNSAELAKNFIEQDLLFKSVKAAKDLSRTETDWDNVLKNKLNEKISADSFAYGTVFSVNDIPTIIDVADIKVEGRKITISYNLAIDYEYRSLRRNGQIEIKLPCSGYYYADGVEEECPSICKWCEECDGYKVNKYLVGKCIEPTASCTYSCESGYCGANCNDDPGNIVSGSTCYFGTCCTESCDIGECCECTDTGCSPDDNSCLCPTDDCVGSDYYDYPDYGLCSEDCVCDVGTERYDPCEPETIEYNSEKCAE